jgi:hypothetical protein
MNKKQIHFIAIVVGLGLIFFVSWQRIKWIIIVGAVVYAFAIFHKQIIAYFKGLFNKDKSIQDPTKKDT